MSISDSSSSEEDLSMFQSVAVEASTITQAFQSARKAPVDKQGEGQGPSMPELDGVSLKIGQALEAQLDKIFAPLFDGSTDEDAPTEPARPTKTPKKKHRQSDNQTPAGATTDAEELYGAVGLRLFTKVPEDAAVDLAVTQWQVVQHAPAAAPRKRKLIERNPEEEKQQLQSVVVEGGSIQSEAAAAKQLAAAHLAPLNHLTSGDEEDARKPGIRYGDGHWGVVAAKRAELADSVQQDAQEAKKGKKRKGKKEREREKERKLREQVEGLHGQGAVIEWPADPTGAAAATHSVKAVDRTNGPQTPASKKKKKNKKFT